MLKLTWFTLMIFLLSCTKYYACDGMSASVLSNVRVSNNQYHVTIQFCEMVSNGIGSAITGIILQSTGQGIITGTTTPSFTSNSTGITINYNQINATTVQWGEWDDDPDVPTFLDFGHPRQCFTMVIITNGPISAVSISGSSAPKVLGGGFQLWFGRYGCKATLPVPPPTCISSWKAPEICPGSGPIDLDALTEFSGVFSGPGVNSNNGMFDPSVVTLPVNVTFTVTEGSQVCSTTKVISSPYNMSLTSDKSICKDEPVNLAALASAELQCTYTLNLEDLNGDGWQGGAHVRLFVKGILTGIYSLSSGSSTDIKFSASNGELITLNYTAGSYNNLQNRVSIADANGAFIYTSNWGPPSGLLGSGITANCGVNKSFNYSWSPASGLSSSVGSSTIATPSSSTTYTVTATNTLTGCVLTKTVSIALTGITPDFTPIKYVCQSDQTTKLPLISNNGVNGTWSPSFSTATAGDVTYVFSPNSGQCATSTTMTITTLGARLVSPTTEVCSESVLNFEAIPNPGPSGISYQWTASPPDGITLSSVSGNGQMFSTIATNNSIEPITFSTPNLISLTMSIQGVTCVHSFNPKINPRPLIRDESTSICSGKPFAVSPTANAPNRIPSGTSYTWLVNNNPDITGESSVSSPQSFIGQVLSSSLNQPTQVIYTVTPSTVTCHGEPFKVIVDIQHKILPTLDPLLPICVGSKVPVLSGLSYNGINGDWSPPLASSLISGIQTFTFTPNADACASTATLSLVIHPLPSISAADASVCQNGSVSLVASGASTYLWSPPTFLSATVGSSVTFTSGSTTTYTITGTSAYGCSATKTVTVTVDPLPMINAGQDREVCDGAQVALTASGGVTYSWSSGALNGVAFRPPLGVTTYEVAGTDNKGCTNSDQVKVTVHSLPSIYAGNDLTVCPDEGITLTASGGSTYIWDNGVSNGVLFYPPVGSKTYMVTGTSLAGCSNTDQVIVTVKPSPVVSFSADKILSCIPFESVLTNTTTNAVDCIWTISDGKKYNSCGPISLDITIPGCLDVSLTVKDSSQCASTTTLNNLVCLVPPPIADFTSNANFLTTYDTEVRFTNLSVGANNYEWTFGADQEIYTEKNPIYEFPIDEVERYTVRLIAISEAGCRDTAYSLVVVNEDLLFYVPNTFTPNQDEYNQTFKPVFTSGFEPTAYTLYIFNRWGQLIFESRDPMEGWDGSFGTWNQSKQHIEICPDGVYTWTIEFTVSKDHSVKTITGHVSLIR